MTLEEAAALHRGAVVWMQGKVVSSAQLLYAGLPPLEVRRPCKVVQPWDWGERKMLVVYDDGETWALCDQQVVRDLYTEPLTL